MADRSRMADAEELLRRTLEEAAASRADMVDFELVPGGMEITPFVGNAGIGTVLEDNELIAALLQLMYERSQRHDSFPIFMQGGARTVTCEWYDSFGENCFRLRFRKHK